MTHKTIILVVLLLMLPAVIIAYRIHTREQRQLRVEKMIRDAERYSGATGPTIKAFDERTDRWITEMKEESPEDVVLKLFDGAEYIPGMLLSMPSIRSLYPEDQRERTVYSADIEIVLANRRFRKAYDDLQKMDKKKAAELLSKNIRENLAELRTMFQGDMDNVSLGNYFVPDGRLATAVRLDSYRPMSIPDQPPTRFGRKYAVLSCILLASFLELPETRPAVQEVIEFAKGEYDLFCSVDDNLEGGWSKSDIAKHSFKNRLLSESLYNPSLLVTATLCDPTWNAEKRKFLEGKLVNRGGVVDWQARALEHDKNAREGWIPVVPHEGMLKIRYYKGITDADFNDFFGK